MLPFFDSAGRYGSGLPHKQGFYSLTKQRACQEAQSCTCVNLTLRIIDVIFNIEADGFGRLQSFNMLGVYKLPASGTPPGG